MQQAKNRSPKRLLLLFTLLPTYGWSTGVDIVVSKNIPIYQQAATAVTTALAAVQTKLHVLNPEDGPGEKILERLRHDKPKVVVAVGAKAVSESLRALPYIPLVYLMVVYPESLNLADNRDAVGVSWAPSPMLLGSRIQLLLPQARRVGIISSDPKGTGVSALRKGLQNLGFDLIVSEAQDSSGIPQALRNLGQVDVLWMGSDRVFAAEAAYDLLRSYCTKIKLPLLVPIRPQLDSGVLAGIYVTPEIASVETGRLVQLLLEGRRPKERIVYPASVHFVINLNAAQGLGIKVSSAALKSANETIGQ